MKRFDGARTATITLEPTKGEDSARELSDGQLFMWDCIEQLFPHGEHLNLMTFGTPPAGTPLEEVVAIIERVIARYESFRTRFEIGDDGRPRQILLKRGSFDVSIVDANDETLDDDAFEFGTEMASTPIPPTEWPLFRLAVLQAKTRSRCVLVVSHLVSDLTSMRILSRELSGAPQAVDDPLWQPRHQSDVDRKRREGSSEARTHRYLRSQLERAPQTQFPMTPGPGEQLRWWQGRLRTQATGVAAQIVGQRYGVAAGTILGAAFATLLAYRTGFDVVAFNVAVGNRFTPESRDAVGTFIQNLPIVLDVDLNDFAATARVLHSAVTAGVFRSLFSPADFWRQTDAINAERGTFTTFDIGLNVLPGNETIETTRYEEPEALRALARSSSFEWVRRLPHEAIHCYMHAFLPASIALLADTAYFAPDDICELLLDIERYLVSLALGEEQTPVDYFSARGSSRFEVQENWYRLGNSLIDLDETAKQVCAAFGVSHAIVLPSDTGELEAFVAAPEGRLDLVEGLARLRQTQKLIRSVALPRTLRFGEPVSLAHRDYAALRSNAAASTRLW